MHLLFKRYNLRHGDKIAVIGKNNACWCIVYMATITYGGIIVPILQDFNPNDMHHIVSHSESVSLFTSDSTWGHLGGERLTRLRGILSLDDSRCLYQCDGGTIQCLLKHSDNKVHKTYPGGFRQEDMAYTDLSNDKIISLNCTFDTTGFSKDAMLTGSNLVGNATSGIRTGLLKKGDKVLPFLLLARTYSCTFDFPTVTAVSTRVTLSGKIPLPKILMKTFEEIEPDLIVTVPFVIEKIYRNVIQLVINEKSMRWALSIPLPGGQIYRQICKRLVDALDDRSKEVIVRGTVMNPEVEEFFYRVEFPFNIGYGMTECGPLISYAPWNEFIPTSPGRVFDITEACIYKENPDGRLGEIQVHGENVVVGHYKNPEVTREVFAEGG